MAFTVEDGTIVADANAWITVAYFEEYWADRGTDLTGTDLALKQAAIVRATAYLSDSVPWAGVKKQGRSHASGEQPTAFPRQGIEDKEGHYVPDTSIPPEVMKACAELANYELNNVNGLKPTYIPHDRVKMEQVGPLKVEYDISRNDASGARPVLLSVVDLIGQFLRSGNSRLAGSSARG